MSEIPEDVMERADEVRRSFGGLHYTMDEVEAIAQALLSERNRALKEAAEAAAALSAQAVQPVAWLHEIIEPEVYLNQATKILSFSPDNPWSHCIKENKD